MADAKAPQNDLKEIAAAWPALNPQTRAMILAAVRAALDAEKTKA